MAVTWKKLAYEDDVITKALLTTKGDMIYASAASTPARLGIGSDNQQLVVNVDVPNWEDPGAPAAHHLTHENGGADEISVAGLSGELADNQPPKAHKTSHQDGGADELSLAGLDGEPSTLTTHKAVKAAAATLGHVIVEAASDIDVDVDGKLTLGGHKTRHQDGGNDEISVAGLSGELADNQPPKAHATNHKSGGSDTIKLNEFTNPDGAVAFAGQQATNFVDHTVANAAARNALTPVVGKRVFQSDELAEYVCTVAA